MAIAIKGRYFVPKSYYLYRRNYDIFSRTKLGKVRITKINILGSLHQ